MIKQEILGLKKHYYHSLNNMTSVFKTDFKTATTIQKVLDVLPKSSRDCSYIYTLDPFSKLIGKGVIQIVDAIVDKRRR